MTTRAAARVLFGVDLVQRRDSAEKTTRSGGCHDSSKDDSPALSCYDMAQDLDDFGAGFFVLPIPFPGTAFYKVRNPYT